MINHFKKCMCGFFVFVLVLLVLLQSYLTDDLGVSVSPLSFVSEVTSSISERRNLQENGKEKIIIWWTPFIGNVEYSRKCGNTRCLFTENRHLLDHSNFKVIERDLLLNNPTR